MKKDVILHIGRHKSGTTSLQNFLCDNEKVLLNYGYFYPKSARKPIAHHPLAKFYNKRLKKELAGHELSSIKQFWNEIEQYDKIIISSEGFQNSDPKLVAKDFQDFNLKIVIYVREQIGYLLSAYAQRIHASRTTLTLEEYKNNIFQADYLEFVNKWKNAFPDAKIIVRNYDRKKLVDYDIRKDFLISAGICSYSEIDNFLYVEEDANPSIGSSLVEFKRLLNIIDTEKKVNDSKIYRLLGKMAYRNKSKYGLKKIIQKKLYNELLEEYSKTNEEFSKVFLPNSPIELSKVSDFRNQFLLSYEEFEEIVKDISYLDKDIFNFLMSQKEDFKKLIEGK